MLSCSRRDRREMSSGPRSRRMTLPPSGSGSPSVRSAHHSPKSTSLRRPFLLVGELAFVDQQPRLDLAVSHRLEDFVKRHHDVLHVGLVQAQREKGGRQRAGNRHGDAVKRGGARLADHHHRPVVVAHAGAMRQQDVLVGQMRVGMKRHGRDLVLALEGRAIQRLDVRQHVHELEVAAGHLAAGQAVEHERVVGIGRMGDMNLHQVDRVDQLISCWAGFGPASRLELQPQSPEPNVSLSAVICRNWCTTSATFPAA